MRREPATLCPAALAAFGVRVSSACAHVDVEALDAFAEHALVPGDPVRNALLGGVAETSGLHPSSVARLANLFLQAWRRPGLDRLVAPVRERVGEARPVGTIALAAPGNLCVATWAALAEALLAGNRVRVRPGAGDLRAASAYHAALALVAPALAERMTVVHCERDDDLGWRHWLRGARTLIAYGSDAGVAATSRRAMELGFSGHVRLHGTRASVAVVRAAALGAAGGATVAERLLHDAVLADGRGCLSLRAVWVVGDLAPRAVAELIAVRLADVCREFPAGHIAADIAAHAALHAADHELRAAIDPDTAAFVGGTDAWVAVHRCPPTGCRPLGPAARGLVVHVVDHLDAVDRAMALATVTLSTVALAPFDDAALLAWARQCGATRSCAPGRMQAPPCWVAHDGVLPFAALIERHDSDEEVHA
ncbi:MAG: hypothetical protein EXR79_00010 [Myxococcales bacterium]|nr:hypothetical protein [Myxococcales bacterium]